MNPPPAWTPRPSSACGECSGGKQPSYQHQCVLGQGACIAAKCWRSGAFNHNSGRTAETSRKQTRNAFLSYSSSVCWFPCSIFPTSHTELRRWFCCSFKSRPALPFAVLQEGDPSSLQKQGAGCHPDHTLHGGGRCRVRPCGHPGGWAAQVLLYRVGCWGLKDSSLGKCRQTAFCSIFLLSELEYVVMRLCDWQVYWHRSTPEE